MILCSELPVAGSIQAEAERPPVKQGKFSCGLKAMAIHDHQAQQFYFQVLGPQDSGLLEILDLPPKLSVPRFPGSKALSPTILPPPKIPDT